MVVVSSCDALRVEAAFFCLHLPMQFGVEYTSTFQQSIQLPILIAFDYFLDPLDIKHSIRTCVAW